MNLLVLAVVTAAVPWSKSQQLVVVVPDDWDANVATLTRWEREGPAKWRPVGQAVQVTIGSKGSAWGLGLHPPQKDGPQKQEGDSRSPAGVFEIGDGFGYGEKAATKLHYLPMTKDNWCVDVPASKLYNRIVDAKAVGDAGISGSTEPMRRDLILDDDAYRVGFVVQHNPKGTPNAGSCIFVHQQREAGRPTAGCTALPAAELDALFAWLDAAKKPAFVLLPRPQYDGLRKAWSLPALP